MSAFDKIIGYESIKEELVQICDMLRNKQKYEDIGAELPKGILLYGPQGTGKTLMVQCFLEECGVDFFTIDRSINLYGVIDDLCKFFQQAKECSTAVIFIDDLDSAVEEGYNTFQIEMDRSESNKVLVIATAENVEKIPDSLLRSGRFDRKIEVCVPNEKDRHELIQYYLRDKKTEQNINYEDLTMMWTDCSCADIKSMINEAAIHVAFSQRKEICMNDFIEACLRREYVAPDIYISVSEEALRKTALHEAGHLVVSEILHSGSVGLVSVRTDGRDDLNGFIRNCKEPTRRVHEIIVLLGGKAAVELYYAETCASGCYSDIKKAFYEIRRGMNISGTCGLGMIDVGAFGIGMSENMNARNEAVVHAEMEKYMFKARDILLKNREFLEKATELLVKNRTLLYSDIRALRESVTITNVDV